MMSVSKYQAQSPLQNCEEHQDEELDIYCYTCKKSICFDCTKSNHVDHQHDKITKIVRKFRQEIHSDLASKEENCLSNLRKGLKTVSSMKILNALNLKATTERIHKQREDLLNIINNMADTLIDFSKIQTEQKQQYLTRSEVQLTKEIKEIEDMLNIIKESSRDLGDHSMSQLKMDFETKMSDMSATCDISDSTESNMHYVEGEINIDQLKCMLGELMENDSSKVKVEEIEGFFHGEKNIIDIVPTCSDEYWIHSFDSPQIELIDVNRQVKTTKEPGNSDMFAVTENGEIFFTYFNANVIKKIDANGVKSMVLHTNPLKPQGISIAVDGDLLVALSDNEKYDLSDNSRRTVQHITRSGEVKAIYEFEEDGSTRLFTFPLRVRQNYNGDILVADIVSAKTGRLCALNCDGKKKFVYNSPKLKNLFLPHDVCCDRTCNIIVADLNNRAIHLLDPRGKFVKYLQIDAVDLKYPRSLGLYKSVLTVGCNKGYIKKLKYKYT